MAPIRELNAFWNGMARAQAVVNHYCARCRRTRKFRQTDALVCLTCGKRLHTR